MSVILCKGNKMQRVFLLGGYDLEMIEIRKILEEKKETFIDRKLLWGATLSSYEDILNNRDEFIAIELEEDIALPKNYILIDHHGKNSHKSSSIQQIAKLLNIKLNRWQKLVSENDYAYISGMKKLHATDKEIDEIRKADRESQGVSDEDEKLAQESINQSNGKNTIKSRTPHFSAVSDRVYSTFTQYIIFNDKKVSFYGYKIEKLIDFLSLHKIAENNYYYGGGNFGFLGIKENVLKEREIVNLLRIFNETNR